MAGGSSRGSCISSTWGCRWRGCEVAYGLRITVYNDFNRWSRPGFREAMLSVLANAGWAGDGAVLDSNQVRAHRSALGGKGARMQAVGQSRGVQTSKSYAVTDALRRPDVLLLTPGNINDVTTAQASRVEASTGSAA